MSDLRSTPAVKPMTRQMVYLLNLFFLSEVSPMDITANISTLNGLIRRGYLYAIRGGRCVVTVDGYRALRNFWSA